ncbi:MAG: S9 family peptidase [Candidatus Wallbacteria bacterium]|nr:S9 family peptidase [Candidatus Wallbacteria bacterium]
MQRLLLLILLIASLISASTLPDPPMAAKFRKIMTNHGDIRIDNYYWLRDKKNPAVISYLEAENAYCDRVMADTESMQFRLYQEMLSRIKEDDSSVPVKKGDYYYYTRTEKGAQYGIHCRKHKSLDAPEEIYLDENQLSQGHDFFSLGVAEVSPDHSLLAIGVDYNGSEQYTVTFKNLKTGEILPDRIENTASSFEWANDNRTVFYTMQDAALRPCKVFRHALGKPNSTDTMIFHEPDELFSLGLGKTRDRKFLFIGIGSITSTEYLTIPADQPLEKPQVFQPRLKDMEYYIDHHSDKFFILTNHKARNFRIMTAPETSTGIAGWQEFIAHKDDTRISDFDVFEKYLVVYDRHGGLPRIRVMGLSDATDYYVDFPESVYTYWNAQNPEFSTDFLRFNYSSMTTPTSVYDHNLSTRERILKKQYEVKGYFKPMYQTERIFARASDGTQIPISIVYRKGLKLDGTNPCYLYGYGSYGNSMDPYFSGNRLSLLNRGFVYALAHVRGGEEMGRHWYENGKLSKKKNTFTDFIACAEHLITEGYTCKEKMFTSGGSAGGLLMGAIANMRPDLFRGLIADVPFVDVMNTMLDPTIPLTVGEYQEWGNPNEPEAYFYMKSYSPYDNIARKDYPHMLVTAGLNDPRVGYWEPAKLVAKLRTHKTDNNILILKTNMGQGHMGASGRYDYLKEIAFEFAFILKVLGMEQ